MANHSKDGALSRSHFWIADLHVQPDCNLVLRKKQEILLEPRMMEVLVLLAEHAGETISKERILIEVWGNTIWGDNPLNKTLSLLRKLIGDDVRNPRYIETINKIGYRMKATVSMPEDYRRMPTELWTDGSPYVGLSAFDSKHAPVYCGRSRIVADLLRGMRNQIENQCRFVMIVGASGCGKTSLLRAGVIPLLTKPDGYDGLRALSISTCDLAAAPAHDPLTPLIEALARWTLDDGGTDGGRPIFPPQTTEQLKSLLTEQRVNLESFITEAFQRHPEKSLIEQPYAHLLLNIDHAEALVSAGSISTETRDAIERLILKLCDCPHVLVTMAARSDFYPKLVDALPALAERKAGEGHLDVLPPRYGEIGEIIRTPAWKANLSFETDPISRDRLDDVLRDAAITHPDALPLLQHTLEALYEHKNEQHQLTFTTYQEIGGLDGAIAHRAEQIYAALPVVAQQSCDVVMARLIVIQRDSDTVSARRAYADEFSGDAKTLVDAFIDARLFVGDHSGGRATVGVAHEALLRRWPRAADWLRENRRLLMAKARLQVAAERWAEGGKQDDHLLNPGRPLGEALEVIHHFTDDLCAHEVDYVSASERMLNRTRRIRQWALAALATLTIISSISAIIAISARIETEKTLKSMIQQSYAFRVVGELVFRNASMKSAEPAFMAVTRTLESAMESNPESEEILFQYAISRYWLGYLYINDGRLREAREQWLIYLNYCKKLSSLSPEKSSWKKELSYAYNNIGNIDLRERKIEQALSNFKISLNIKKRLISSNAVDPGILVEYSDTLSWIGSTEESIARFRDASSRYDEQILILRSHTSTPASTDDHHRQFANALWRSARLSSLTGQEEKAENQIQESVSILTRLTSSHPRDDIFKKDLANALLEASTIHRMQNKNHDADVEIEHAKKTINDIRMNENSPPAWLRLRETVNFQHALHRIDANRDMRLDESISKLEELYRLHPEQVQIAIDIANSRIARARMNETINRTAVAFIDYQKAIEIISPFALESADHTILRPWISAHESLGNASRIHSKKMLLLNSGYKKVYLTPNYQ